MGRKADKHISIHSLIAALCACFFVLSCHTTRHVPEGEYLLWNNKVELSTQKVMTNRGEIKDNLANIIAQKPNSTYISFLPTRIPMKLWRYNRKYKKLYNKPDSLLPKQVERPVIFDTLSLLRSAANMRNYMFNQGYFYAQVRDTVIYRKRKAYVTYYVNAGSNYIINRINLDIDDTAIAAVVRNTRNASNLLKGNEFTFSQLEEERSRLVTTIVNHGYRRFSLDNISFKIDTQDKSVFRVASSPFENAVNFIAQTKSNKKSTIDIDIIIRKTDDSLAYNRYVVNKVTVFPDYDGNEKIDSATMIHKSVKGMDFWYHKEYVHAPVLYKHIFINETNLYSKYNEDRTTARLGELGLFQYIRVQYRENRTTRDSVDVSILMSRAKKHDFSTNYEISNGTTYALGNSIGVNYRDKNLAGGANQLSIGASGGLETYYNDEISQNIPSRFKLLTWYYGINAGIDFPKFLAPFGQKLFTNSNLPHTLVNLGESVIERINYFRLVNSSANFSYSWSETPEKTWSFSPAFMNIIRVYATDSFRNVISRNEYLKNSYKENFIEGENIAFKLDNSLKKHGINNTYARLAFEEAGSIPAGFISIFSAAFPSLNNKVFAQYTKFDFDARHYFNLKRSVLAFRFYGGVGTPYGASSTLPYIKQYFAGGPYSLRGWRIRTLGPGSYFDTAQARLLYQIDRTGDIKMEMNGEYRFPVAPLFAGALKMNGAFFADAGNIWLSRPNAAYPGGDFSMTTIGQDIAMDIGIGSRFDIASFLTVRFDVAMPVKKPYIHSNSGWVFNQIDFSNPTWRSDNLVLNISIGYPF